MKKTIKRFTKKEISKLSKDQIVTALYRAINEAYKSDVLDCDMYYSIIGENNDFKTVTDWKESKLREWTDE